MCSSYCPYNCVGSRRALSFFARMFTQHNTAGRPFLFISLVTGKPRKNLKEGGKIGYCGIATEHFLLDNLANKTFFD